MNRFLAPARRRRATDAVPSFAGRGRFLRASGFVTATVSAVLISGCAGDQGSVSVGPGSAGGSSVSQASTTSQSSATQSSTAQSTTPQSMTAEPSASTPDVSVDQSLVVTHAGAVLTTVQLVEQEVSAGDRLDVPEGTAALVDLGDDQKRLFVAAHVSEPGDDGVLSTKDFSAIFRLVQGDSITYFDGDEQQEFTVTSSEAVEDEVLLTVPEASAEMSAPESQTLTLITVESGGVASEADYEGRWVVTAESAQED